MTTPDAAIEAAAEAMYLTHPDNIGWLREDQRCRDAFRREARTAIEAAMPAILTDLREGLDDLLRSEHLEPGVEEHPEGTCPICDWVGCLQDEWLAALIVRGGTP